MSYVVLARKWRPQNFDEVVGQEHVTTTLKNSIDSGRVAHAYLFTGPRGIGKTSTARILAKALNCEKGPAPNPCNKCPSCEEIAKGFNMDVLEIDGASNRGIDQIRQLRENIGLSPASSRYRIYIIDEVHMLTTEAFNALLKTLEEPPAHAKFIFATTQPHKVPLTISSRCQRFDFKPIAAKLLIDKLKQIADAEKVKITAEAIEIVARSGEGSLRDAESILDQLISFSEGQIEAGDVISLLGLVGSRALFDLTRSFLDKNPKKALEIVGGLIDDGKDVFQIVNDLLVQFRNLMLIKERGESGSVEIEQTMREELAGLAKDFSSSDILYAFDLLARTLYAMKQTPHSRTSLEMAVVKLAQTSSLANLEEILQRISRLEEKVSSDVSTYSEPAGGEEGTKAPVPRAEGPGAQRPWSHGPTGRRARGTKEEEGVETAHKSTEEVVSRPWRDKAAGAKEEEENSLNLEQIKKAWHSVWEEVKKQKMSTAAYLREGVPSGFKRDVLTIGFSARFSLHKEVLEEVENRKLIEKALNELFGKQIKVKFTTVEGAQMPFKVGAQPAQPAGVSKKIAFSAEKIDEPIIQSAIKIFKGKLV